MSRNPRQSVPYGRPQHHQEHQVPIPPIGSAHFPNAPTVSLSNVQVQTMTSAVPHHQIPVEMRTAYPPSGPAHHVSSGQEMAMFEALAVHQPQNPPLYSESAELSQSNISHPAFVPSTTQQGPLRDVYSQPSQSRSHYAAPIWQPDQGLQPHQLAPPIPPQRAHPGYHPHQQLSRYEASASRSAPIKRERQIDSALPHPMRTTAIVSTPQHPTPGSSTDTRKGKERVQRPCMNCGEMNHIRKNKCSRCDTPKEPAKKRTKRSRRKKPAVQVQAPAAGQTTNALLLSHRQGVVSDHLNQISVDRAESLVERQHPRQDAIQPGFDPRALGFAQSSQPQGSTTVETQPMHPARRGQRPVPDFPADAPFDDNQGNFTHP